jgi:hypothetical protein
MEKKKWKLQLKEGVTFEDLVLAEPIQGINAWLKRCEFERLRSMEEDMIIRTADRLNRISYEKVSPAKFAKEWRKTVNV